MQSVTISFNFDQCFTIFLNKSYWCKKEKNDLENFMIYIHLPPNFLCTYRYSKTTYSNRILSRSRYLRKIKRWPTNIKDIFIYDKGFKNLYFTVHWFYVSAYKIYAFLFLLLVHFSVNLCSNYQVIAYINLKNLMAPFKTRSKTKIIIKW